MLLELVDVVLSFLKVYGLNHSGMKEPKNESMKFPDTLYFKKVKIDGNCANGIIVVIFLIKGHIFLNITPYAICIKYIRIIVTKLCRPQQHQMLVTMLIWSQKQQSLPCSKRFIILSLLAILSTHLVYGARSLRSLLSPFSY